ncbi:serine protease filzig isoform X2 [Eurosta solidaginis]
MFNHECAQRNGEVVGACMDGFLFGACCQIPDELDLESTLLNDAQSSYLQQHQQQTLQDEYSGGINQAVAQSYETYGENQQQQQQHSQENKYNTPASKPIPKPKPQRIQKPQQQQQKYKPEVPKPIYGNDVENALLADSYTQASINKLYQQLGDGISTNSYYGQHDAIPSNQYQDSSASSSSQYGNRPAVGPTASYGESVDTTSSLADSSLPHSSSVENEKDAPLQQESQTRPVKVPFTTSSQTLNDDFVLGFLSTTLPPAEDSTPISVTPTGLPMRIVNGLTEPNSSSESVSFEEFPVTQSPMKVSASGSKAPSTQSTQSARPKPKPRPQKPRPRPQAQAAKPTSLQQPAKTQSVKQTQKQKQKPKPKPQQQQQTTNSQNHLMLDGGEFTHSDITHPGADTDLIEDDLQFSTGYGPQPVFMAAPVRQPSPISYNPTTSSSTSASIHQHAASETDKNAEQASKKPTTYGEPTTGTSFTTHVDSIESIILQLNGTTSHGPTYNIVSQQAPETASYSADVDNSDKKYESTTGMSSSSSYGDATTNYYDATGETKRPNNYYIEAEHSNAPVTATVPAYYDSVITDHGVESHHAEGSLTQQQPSHSYVSKPTAATELSGPTAAHTYGDDVSAVLDEHTMPANNYDDVSQSASHPTHEFNKMPAVGIAYPVDISNMEEDESSLAGNYGQRPQYTPTSVNKITGEIANGNNYEKVPIITGKPQRPVTINSQNNNGIKLPSIIHYDAVPPEVSVSSHTTKVEDSESSSAAYQTTKPDSLSTIHYMEETTFAQHPTAIKATTTAYLTTSTTPAPSHPQYNTATTGTSTARPISGIITSSGTRPRPKPRPKPSTALPNNQNTRPSTAKRPTNTKPAQPTNTYGSTPVLIKKPSAPQNQAQSPEKYNNKRPALQPTNNHADNSPVDDSSYVKKPSQTQAVKRPINQHNKQSIKQPVKQPAAIYQQNKPAAIKRPTQQQQPSSNYNGESTTHVLHAEPVYQRPEQEPTYDAEESATTSAEHVFQITDTYEDAAVDINLSADSYDHQDTKVTAENYAQDYDKPDATYNQDIKAPQPTFDPEAYYPAPKPSLNYNPELSNKSTNRPIIIRKPSVEPVPTPARPSTTVIYHDAEVPPLVMADHKLDALSQSAAQTETDHSQSSTYQGQVEPLEPVKLQYAERPQYTYVHKKPGFVRVTSKPITTTYGVNTAKPTLFTLVTNSGWSQRPGSISAIYNDNAYPPTTPLPLAGLGSTSYIYNPVVTRRPDIMLNTPEYASLSGVTSNDFDDPGYYGVQNVQQNVYPAFTQSVADAEYGIPSDDRPAFPGYYGPTPTYPPFPIPGEKLGAPVEEETYTSPNDFVNFPPVRNPNLNMSATSSAVTTDLELSTPAFVEDGVLKDKMNTLVHKIVESLQGNFDALADMIDDVNNTAAPTPIGTYQAGAAGAGAGGAVTTRKPTRKPQRTSATAKPTTTKRPVTRLSTKQPTRRTPASSQRPVASRRTTTTRQPATRNPTRRVTTTTTPQPLAEDELIDEEDEEDVNPAENEIGVAQDEGVPGAGGRKFKCGVRPHIKSGRIVGGKGSTFGAYPWQVLVRESTWLGLFTKNKCGGVLITNRYVTTAAHCQPGFLASLVAVMGEFDISGDLESKRSVTKNVKRVIVHRQYDPATFENDLALLELDSQVQFDTHIVPICMPNDHADFTGRMATVTGWGRLKYGGGVPSVLQEVQVPIIENSVCQEMFHTAGHNKKILSSFLCAGYANGQKDSCEGDSGGPLVLPRPDGRYELAGTVSHGIKCAAPYLPGVYMRTTFYKPWLRSITGVK